jgi:hypothetical protein
VPSKACNGPSDPAAPDASMFRGRAIDIEYQRSPYIPMRQAGGSHPVSIDTSSYRNIPGGGLTKIAAGCVAVWDNACNMAMANRQPPSAHAA